MVVRFQVVSPPAKQRTFTVRLPILIGRGEEAKFRIQHDLVSRKHCELFEREGRVCIRDLGSTNGTFLDDEQVPASTRTAVPPGATVRVGGLSFKVEYEPPADDGDSTATVEGQRRADAVAAGESRVETGEVRLEHLADPPDFKIEHAEQGDEAAAAAEPAPTETRPLVVEGEEPPSLPVAAAEGFAFLADTETATPAEPTPAWPSADPAADSGAPGDDQLDAFFKGLK